MGDDVVAAGVEGFDRFKQVVTYGHVVCQISDKEVINNLLSFDLYLNGLRWCKIQKTLVYSNLQGSGLPELLEEKN